MLTTLRTWRDAIRARLIDDWHKKWSVWITGIGTMLATTWASLPQDMRDHFPSWMFAAMFAAAFVARNLKQGKRDDDA